MKPRRLFAFGCSFTQYKWPTWADILGKSFDLSYNLGKSGDWISWNYDTPHMAANIGTEPRYTLQITGHK